MSEPLYDLETQTWDHICPCIIAEQRDPECTWHGRSVQARIEAVLAAHSVARFNVSHHHVGTETCPLPDELTSDCPERRLECRCGQVMPHPTHRTHVAAIVMREASL